jgi:hypothetical protein
MGPSTFIKRELLAMGSTARINPAEGVSGLLIWAADFAMDDHQRSSAVMVVRGGTVAGVTELGLRSARCDDQQQKMKRQE